MASDLIITLSLLAGAIYILLLGVCYYWLWGRKKGFLSDLKLYYGFGPATWESVKVPQKHWPFFVGLALTPFVVVAVGLSLAGLFPPA